MSLSRAPVWVQRWGPTVALLGGLVLLVTWVESRTLGPLRTDIFGLKESLNDLTTEVSSLKYQVAFMRGTLPHVSEQMGEAATEAERMRGATDRTYAVTKSVESKLDSLLSGKRRQRAWWP